MEAAKKTVLAKARKATAPIKVDLLTNGKQKPPALEKHPKAKERQLTNGSSKMTQMSGTKMAPRTVATAQVGRRAVTKTNTEVNRLSTSKVWPLPTNEVLNMGYMRMLT